VIRIGAALAAMALALTGCSSSGPAQTAGSFFDQLHGTIPDTHPAKPEFTLRDTTGSAYDFGARTHDDVTLLYFGYTHCPDECPTSMADLASALRQVGPSVASQVRVVFVTTDPWRDTGSRLRDWLGKFDRSFVGLRGTPRQLGDLEVRMGLPPSHRDAAAKNGDGSRYSVTHFAAVLAYDRDGRLATLYPSGVAPSDIAADLDVLAKEDAAS
jgi:protein SCO1/2